MKGEPTNIDKFERRKRNLEKNLVETLESCCDGFLALGDSHFPQHRGRVKDSERPVFLYYKGDISLLSFENKNISVIGLLNPKETLKKEKEKSLHDL